MSWRPLEGVRVLDLSGLLPGPFASHVLSDLGATVIKVERPGSGDAMRTLQPEMFAALNAGKHSVALDLREPADNAVLRSLASEADILLEGFRPGVLSRLGAGFEDIKRINDRIVYVSLSGWGQDGPLASDPGHNGTFTARTGALHLNGPAGVPEEIPVPFADLAAALYSVIAAVAAIRDGNRTAVHLDVGLFSSALAFSLPRIAEYVGREATSAADVMERPANGVFACSDGYILIAAVEDHFWSSLCDALDLSDLSERPEYIHYGARKADAAAINARISQAVAGRGRSQLVAELRAAGVPVSPVIAPNEVHLDEQVRHLGYLEPGRPLRAILPIRGVDLDLDDEVESLDASGNDIRSRGWGAIK